MTLTQDSLRSILLYDKYTGRFWWRTTGAPAGYHQSEGYIQISINGKRYYAHNLAWFYTYGGKLPKNKLDHKNLNKKDNRISNLREATQSQNLRNRRVRKDSASGLKGVYFEKDRKKWCAYICVDRKRKVLGRFLKKEDASAAYMNAVKLVAGEFARSA